jgi:hypothetical protein
MFVETAKTNNLNPYEYLKTVFEKPPIFRIKAIGENCYAGTSPFNLSRVTKLTYTSPNVAAVCDVLTARIKNT